MTKKVLNDYARMGLSPDYRKIKSNTAPTMSFNYVNGYISQYGVGGKQAGFYIGKDIVLSSCMRGKKQVLELILSEVRLHLCVSCVGPLCSQASTIQDRMAQLEQQGQSAFRSQLVSRQPGHFDESLVRSAKYLKSFVAAEPKYVRKWHNAECEAWEVMIVAHIVQFTRVFVNKVRSKHFTNLR